MRFATSFLLALGVASGIHAGWTIPENQPDGTYMVTVDEAGNSHHELVESIPAAPAPERRTNSAKFSPRAEVISGADPGYTITCLGYYLDHNDADQAGSRLGAQCGSGGSVGGHKSYYTKYGSVVAFFCNNNTGTNTCYVWEFQDAVVSKGPAICGNYAGVTVKFNGKGGTYGQATGSASFCY